MYLIIKKYDPEIILEDYFITISSFVFISGFFLARITLKAINEKKYVTVPSL